MFLGAHDLNFMSGQTSAVKGVQSLDSDGSFPPMSDLSMIHLTVPARIGGETPFSEFLTGSGNNHNCCVVYVCSNQDQQYSRCA